MTQQEFFKRYTYNVRTDKIGGGSLGTIKPITKRHTLCAII
jgi:hypothetical protein